MGEKSHLNRQPERSLKKSRFFSILELKCETEKEIVREQQCVKTPFLESRILAAKKISKSA